MEIQPVYFPTKKFDHLKQPFADDLLSGFPLILKDYNLQHKILIEILNLCAKFIKCYRIKEGPSFIVGQITIKSVRFHAQLTEVDQHKNCLE